MGMQQISGRMRAAPTQAVRAFFAGIGRILLTADRPEARVPAAGEHGTADNGQGAASAGWRDLDKTGNVRLLSAEDMAIEFGNHEAAGTTATAAVATAPADADLSAGDGLDAGAVDFPAGELGPEADAPDAGGADLAIATVPELPLSGYDQLSLPSIRARLRNLDADQLRILAEYERTHAERTDVLGMFERRIEKIEAGG